jgi:putative flippase GtrA
LVTSAIVFAAMDWLGIRPGLDAAAAFAAGAVPNWWLNREWVWPDEHPGAWAHDIVAYTAIAVLIWGVSTWATGHTQNWATVHVGPGSLDRVLLGTAAYVGVQAAFFTVKCLIYDNWVFRPTRACMSGASRVKIR